MFTFLAKQNQHREVAAALGMLFDSPVKQESYQGSRGTGVMVSMPLPDGVSKRTVDRSLHRLGVVGAVARRNLPIFKAYGDYLDMYKISDRLGNKERFIASVNGKLRKARLKWVRTYCDCCGDYMVIEYLN